MLWSFVERKEAGTVLTEPFLVKLPGDLHAYSPDIFFLSIDRQALLRANFLDGAPYLVVEVICSENRARDRGEKFENYDKAGVREYRVIDPERRRVEFYGLGADGFYEPVLPDAAGVVHSRVLEGLWVKPGWFWQKPLPDLLSILREWRLIPDMG